MKQETRTRDKGGGSREQGAGSREQGAGSRVIMHTTPG